MVSLCFTMLNVSLRHPSGPGMHLEAPVGSGERWGVEMEENHWFSIVLEGFRTFSGIPNESAADATEYGKRGEPPPPPGVW